MTKLTRLQREATEGAKFRGHALGHWTYREHRTIAYTSCQRCGAGVYVTSHPAPNEADVMGSAVAVGCTAKGDNMGPVGMTKRLDKEARTILQDVVKSLRVALPDAEVSDPNEGMYCSSRYDAGASSTVRVPGLPLLDISVRFNSSEEYEGEFLGWSFGFSSTWEGGEIGPGGTMYNYTQAVWTRDRDEIEERLESVRDYAPDFVGEIVEAANERLQAGVSV